MSREIDAALASAHELTREPQQAPKPAQKPKAAVPVKAGAPAVKVDHSGKRVRLRLIDHALPICVSTEKGDIRIDLEPDKWTRVPDTVYAMLRDKFYKPQETEVVDWNGNPQDPKSLRHVEKNQEYIIEFPDEQE